MPQTKKDITSRFLMMCDELVKDGTCKSRKVFAISVGEHPQNLTLMAKGSRAPTLEQIARASELYGYSPTWLILDKGLKKLSDPDPEGLAGRMDDLEAELESVKRLLKKKTVTGT